MSNFALAHNWNILRGALKDGLYTDLKLVAENGEIINCHKLVLASSSKKIKNILDSRNDDNIVFRNIKYSTLRYVVDFIYNGLVNVASREELMDFASAYMMLQVELGPKVETTIQDIVIGRENDEKPLKGENFIKVEYSVKTEDPLNIQTPTERIDDAKSTELTCETCVKTFLTKKAMTRHIREVHNGNRKTERKLYSCDNCSHVSTNKKHIKYCACKTNKRNRRSKYDYEEDPWSRCIYKCSICMKTASNRRTLRQHVVRVHNMNYVSYVEEYGDTCVEGPKWTCLICSSCVNFTRDGIQKHLSTHQISLSKYELIHGIPPPEGNSREEITTCDIKCEIMEYDDSTSELYSPGNSDVC